MKTPFEGIIPSVNYHVWEPCNMRCKFCFAPFYHAKKLLPKGHLPKEKSLELVKQLAGFGFEKITFAGGEPTLCPWISELISEAKKWGMTTMIVTNGTNINEVFLEQNKGILDWIILSVDSMMDETNLQSGRAISGKKTISKNQYKTFIDQIKKYGYQLKINTVVHQLNYHESMSELIQYAQPERWKVFQVLPIKGENDEHINDFIIDEEMFNQFISNHHQFFENQMMVAENNAEMKDSYVMVDPAGRFYTNKNGKQEYSFPILETGIKNAYDEMRYNYQNFINRRGLYQWNKNK
ncbi:viperin family antiviral radical SAM protein [Chryseobacterium formosus]|uniref:S-adenosylmethionine-dependent nucleotide dehydratase n=1 Tax=Chryseobacterium formosus TaxID=1537363 RepID=A0ABT3XNR0_9FLAO|nr:viperin family antiviral radical SAM protein [Chryseobacterium formosus]MCX8523127.1 viperin family antiviral radical SAM protein [Chryseobacterium formosus]